MTHRRIGAHVLRHARRLAYRVVQVVPKHAARGRRLAELAGAAGEHQHVILSVFFRVEHVGALAAEAEGCLVSVRGGLVAVGGGGGGRRGHGWYRFRREESVIFCVDVCSSLSFSCR